LNPSSTKSSKDFVFREEKIRSYFRDLISALEYCHVCAGIVHRDIKPENVLIDNNDRVILADFGVS
jgi:serine/threonine protein kinase